LTVAIIFHSLESGPSPVSSLSDITTKFQWNAQTPSELRGSHQFLRPLPQGLVGILNLGLSSPRQPFFFAPQCFVGA